VQRDPAVVLLGKLRLGAFADKEIDNFHSCAVGGGYVKRKPPRRVLNEKGLGVLVREASDHVQRREPGSNVHRKPSIVLRNEHGLRTLVQKVPDHLQRRALSSNVQRKPAVILLVEESAGTLVRKKRDHLYRHVVGGRKVQRKPPTSVLDKQCMLRATVHQALDHLQRRIRNRQVQRKPPAFSLNEQGLWVIVEKALDNLQRGGRGGGQVQRKRSILVPSQQRIRALDCEALDGARVRSRTVFVMVDVVGDSNMQGKAPVAVFDEERLGTPVGEKSDHLVRMFVFQLEGGSKVHRQPASAQLRNEETFGTGVHEKFDDLQRCPVKGGKVQGDPPLAIGNEEGFRRACAAPVGEILDDLDGRACSGGGKVQRKRPVVGLDE
jgi:hypothetical protein